MHTARAQSTHPFLTAQAVRHLDMFDGALPPEPPEAPVSATHDFLVLCLRPGDPPLRLPSIPLRSAA